MDIYAKDERSIMTFIEEFLPTICVNCKHHVKMGFKTHICKHPDFKPRYMIDPVTGREVPYEREKGYDIDAEIMSPLEMMMVGQNQSSSPYPLCKDINNGNCPRFEKKSKESIHWKQTILTS